MIPAFNWTRVAAHFIIIAVLLMPISDFYERQASDRDQPIPIDPATPQAGITTRVSLSSSGQQGNRESRYPSISSDGRFVVLKVAVGQSTQLNVERVVNPPPTYLHTEYRYYMIRVE